MQATGQPGAADKAPSIRRLTHHIDGASCLSIIERRNPATNSLIATWPDGTPEDVDRAVDAARAAFADGRWSGLPANQRSEVLRRTGDFLKLRCHEIGAIKSAETGKPLKQSVEEVPWATDLWGFAAGQARSLHGDSHADVGHDKLGLVLRKPIGVVGMITPWNYPLLVLSQKLVYALAAGCTVVAKPSELTSGTTILLASLLEEAGLPTGIFNVVTGYGDLVGKRIAKHPDIDMVSFTGSTAVVCAAIAAVRVGDPLDERTTVGAIIDSKQYEKLLRYIEEGKRGARLALGGSAIILGEGLIIQPTVFTHVTPDLSIARDAIFGPVLAILPFKTKEDAARLAVRRSMAWPRRCGRATSIQLCTRRGRFGPASSGSIPSSTCRPRFRWGGVKQSGIGRENGRHAIEEFTNIKTVVIHSGPNRAWFLDADIRARTAGAR